MKENPKDYSNLHSKYL